MQNTQTHTEREIIERENKEWINKNIPTEKKILY